MDGSSSLTRDVDNAIADLDALLASCTATTGDLRCGRDSRTVSAIANHVADWLRLLTEVVPTLDSSTIRPFYGEVAEETDAALAKSAAGSSLDVARASLERSRVRLRVTLGVLTAKDLEATLQSGNRRFRVGSFIRSWGCDHVVEHTVVIQAALAK